MRAALVLFGLMLASCSAETRPGSTPGEDRALDAAAASLEANAADYNSAIIVDADEGGDDNRVEDSGQ